MIIEISVAVLVIIILCNLCIKYSRLGRFINRIPGPFAYPVIGNIFDIQVDNETLFKKLRESNESFYPIWRLWSFQHAAVNIRHPDDIETVLSSSKQIDKSIIYKYLHPWLGTGLLTSTGSKWYKRRKILTPAFHFNVLTHFFDIFVESSQHLVQMLKEEGKGEPIVKDLAELIGNHTLNALCETAMGISMRGKSGVHNDYQKAVKTIGHFVLYRLARPWYHYDFIFNLSFKGQSHRKLLKILHSFTDNIIAERKEYHESTDRKYLQNFDKINEKTADSNSESYVNSNNVLVRNRRLAMLDLLISASLKDNAIDDKGIREEVDTFTFEGHDTTSAALCFALLLFAKHKDVQERLREEVNEVMMEKDFKLTASKLQTFSYLERCMKESLRLYPGVPFISRLLAQDCQLGEYTIPAGAMCHLHIYDVHRDPAFWPDPLVFDPDRFLPENIKNRHPYSYIPFSAGLRNCIGQKFAMMEMKVTLAFVLHNFVLEPVCELDDVRFVMDVVLRAAHPLPVKFVPLR